MKEILLKLKKTFWKFELIYLFFAAAFIFGGLSYIPRIRENPSLLWNLVWNCSFGLLFLSNFLTAKNRILRELIRFRFYVYFAITLIVYVIMFSIISEDNITRLAHVITFMLCETLVLFGCFFTWRDYKKEKYLATRCQGRGTRECNLEMSCLMCEEYRDYMTPDEISVALVKYQAKEKRRWERKKFFNKLKRKK